MSSYILILTWDMGLQDALGQVYILPQSKVNGRL